MKQIFTLVVLLTFGVITSNANVGDPTSKAMQANLEKSFAGAKLLQWHELKSADLYYAHILYNNEHLNAYFDQDGELVATGRSISAGALPLVISQSISRKYGSATIEDVIEYISKEQTSYLVTLQSGDKELVVHAFTDGGSYIFKKAKKSGR